MSPTEWWWLHDVNRPRDPALDYAGALDDDTAKELYEWLQSEG